MMISQKCDYALRAIFELARRQGSGPVSVSTVAREQQMPARFLENILNQLKQAGLVASRRGKQGGYQLARPSSGITVGEVVRFMEGAILESGCLNEAEPLCARRGSCALESVWRRGEEALAKVLDSTTFEDLVRQQLLCVEQGVNFTI